MNPEYSVIVPVYNGERSVQKLHEAICGFFDGRYPYEIILVDDRSDDNSWTLLKELKSRHTHTRIIRLTKNFGQHAATICGFSHARGNFIITIDDDLEVHPREIEKLIRAQKTKDADVVYGEYQKINRVFLRNLFTGAYKKLSKVENTEAGKGSSFRLIKRSLAKKLADNHKSFVFIDELLLWYTSHLAFEQVDANKDYVKANRYKMHSLFSMAGNVIMFSSTYPLRMVTRIGFLLFAVNFIIGTFFLFKKIFLKIQVAGYTSLIISILFSTGLIIFCIGILAQYLAQAIKALNHQPAYSEDEVHVND